MPLRVHLGEGPGAVVVEVDTPDEAVRLQQAYMQASKRVHAAAARSARPTLFPVSAVPLKSPVHVIFKNGHYRAFEALYAAGETGLQTEAMAELLGVKPKGIPPTMAAWGKRAASLGLQFRELLEVDRGYVHGKPSTHYRLTAKGREVLRPETEPARIASDSGR
jgi:hypothetical protein